MSSKFLLPENIRGKFSKNTARELVFGDELEERLQAERVVWGKAGGEWPSRTPSWPRGFCEQPLAPSGFLQGRHGKVWKGMKWDPCFPTLTLMCTIVYLHCSSKDSLKDREFLPTENTDLKQLDCSPYRTRCNHLPKRHVFRVFSYIFTLTLKKSKIGHCRELVTEVFTLSVFTMNWVILHTSEFLTRCVPLVI